MENENGNKLTRHHTEEARDVGRRLDAIYHDINNPISIVAGNAELLLEMAISAGLGPEFVDPLSDIEKATREISQQVERLIELKDRVVE